MALAVDVLQHPAPPLDNRANHLLEVVPVGVVALPAHGRLRPASLLGTACASGPTLPGAGVDDLLRHLAAGRAGLDMTAALDGAPEAMEPLVFQAMQVSSCATPSRLLSAVKATTCTCEGPSVRLSRAKVHGLLPLSGRPEDRAAVAVEPLMTSIRA